MRVRHGERGQAVIAASLLVVIVALIAGWVVDVYRVREVRSWAYRAAEVAALSGVAEGRDLSAVYTAGQPRIDPLLAKDEAERTLQAALGRRGVTAGLIDVRVVEWGGATINGYPPVARADLWGNGSWFTDEPAVGVYLEIPVQTFLLGLANQGTFTVHVFAAAGLGEI